MSDTATQNTEAQEAPKTETVKGFKSLDDLPARTIFRAGENATQAAADHVRKIMETEGFPELNLPLVVYGVDEEGNVDWSKYEGQDIYVIMLRNKGQGFRALVVQPTHVLADKIGEAAGVALDAPEIAPWITDLMETQVAHKMVRSLRAKQGDTSAPITDADIAAIPHSIADYVATQRLGGAVAFWNKHAKAVIDAIGNRIPSFKAARITKDFLRQALQSKPFALAIYPSFEEAGLFVKVGEALIQVGEKEGADTSTIRAWIDNRENVEAAEATQDIEDVDVDDLFSDMTAG